MPYYRELAGDREFRCAKCGRRKRVKYVPRSNLCRDCAAKNRRKVENTAIQLEKNLVITRMVERRFEKKAEKEIPQSLGEIFGEWMHRWGILIFWATAYFPASAISRTVSFRDEWLVIWLVILVWCLGAPYTMWVIIDRILAKPRKERAERIRLRVVELAEERKRRIEEAAQFYSSPEWNMIRKQVIQEKGRVCAECGRRIKQNDDITVDHIKPRSKFPDLALNIENLRVLCRSCNSKKGDREFEELVVT